MSFYEPFIRRELEHIGKPELDPRHVEAFIRVGNSTLDGLSREALKTEVLIGAICVECDGIERAEQLAKSYGL